MRNAFRAAHRVGLRRLAAGVVSGGVLAGPNAGLDIAPGFTRSRFLPKVPEARAVGHVGEICADVPDPAKCLVASQKL
ncbi:hypothetical protein [Frankia tisae]|uniref:hypothetical protein n=1 Tax=Frankia tisae TaxID=2950104 RepID=UPI0021C1F25F|nr:hypothetical protein [Frankia tisae]